MRTNSESAKRVLSAVRNSTSALHKELDRHVGGDQVLAGHIGREHYLRMLKAHWSLHRLVARHTAAAQQTNQLSFLDWPNCQRLDALSLDLESLGEQSNSKEGRLSSVPLQCAAFTAGLLYVVEGACLGNKQMLKALRKNREFVSWNAWQFMQLSGDSIRERWPKTLTLLCEYGDDQLEAVTQGAINGFSFYKASWNLATAS